MSRYPFMEYVDQFMKGMEGVYAEATVPGLYRRYRRMNRDFITLKEANKVSTLSPKSMTPDDIKEFLVMRKAKNLSFSEMRRDISAIKNLCKYCNNSAVDACLLRYPTIKPSNRHDARLSSFTSEEFEIILDKYRESSKDWKHVRAYSMVFLSIYCGARTKEIRFADVEDLDINSWEFTIKHPKGEGSYGISRIVPIPPAVRSVFSLYIAMRKEWVSSSGKNICALFPSDESEDGYLSGNTMRAVKTIVEKDTGLKFDFRKCRRSFGQAYVDMDLDIESVSVLMGHSSTKTTEKFYARRRNDTAIEKAKNKWKDSNDIGLKSENSNAGYKEIVPTTGFEPVNLYRNGS